MRPNYSSASQPSYEPITLDQAMAHVRVDSEDDMDYLTSLIPVAREYAEGITGRVCVRSGWLVVGDSWSALFAGCNLPNTIPIYRTPLVAVQSISYYPAGSETLTELTAGTDFRVVTATEPGLIQMIGTLPTVECRPDAIQIAFTAGHETAADSPAILRHAVNMLVAHFYEQRVPVAFASTSQIPFGLSTLLENQKVGGWFG